MAVLRWQGKSYKVPNGTSCSGCQFNEYRASYNKILFKMKKYDEYTYCELFQKRTPKELKTADCIFNSYKD